MGLFDADDWGRLATSLGLTPYAVSTGYARGMGFRSLRRSLAVPRPLGAPSYNHWLYGTWKGAEVMVLVYVVGSGKNRRTYTAVLARIDPPLFLGATLRTQGFLDDLFAGPDIVLGEPLTDGQLNIQGFDAQRVREFFRWDDAEAQNALAHLRNASKFGLYATDTMVELSDSGVESDPAFIARRLDIAASAAGALAARRMRMPFSRNEELQLAEWQRFADTSGFKLDARRMKLTGVTAGSNIELALETEGKNVYTAVSVRFPMPIPFGFTLRRTNAPSFLQGVFSQDIEIGHPAFDDLFIVSGNPPGHVRHLLTRNPVPDLLVALGRRSTEVQMHHEGLFFRLAGASTSAQEVAGLVEYGRLTSATLFGEVSAAGPYR